MIIIPPSITRTNQCSTAINEHSDFTRRIPSVPPKQAARASKMARQLYVAFDVEGNPERAKEIFFKGARLLSNPHYWEFLRTIWVIAGKTENANEFKPYFKSPRPCKGWFMTPEDSQTLEEMEWPITIYRAYDPKWDTPEGQATGGDPGISWTTDKEWCEGYAQSKGRIIKQRTVERKEVFAYISRRGESEIIIID